MIPAGYYLVKYFLNEDEEEYKEFDCYTSMYNLHMAYMDYSKLDYKDPKRPYKMGVQIEAIIEYELPTMEI